jgi:FixJ family two-component response regulator
MGQLEPRPRAWFPGPMPIPPPIPDVHLVAIVDDDASVRQSARRLIRSLGHRAEAFGSAEEFLDSGQASETACLILDVRMPGMDGLELQPRLADSDPPIPIVFITARASDQEANRALRAGAVAFLRKPVDKETLLRGCSVRFSRGRPPVEETLMPTDLVDPLDRCARRLTVPSGAPQLAADRSELSRNATTAFGSPLQRSPRRSSRRRRGTLFLDTVGSVSPRLRSSSDITAPCDLRP